MDWKSSKWKSKQHNMCLASHNIAQPIQNYRIMKKGCLFSWNLRIHLPLIFVWIELMLLFFDIFCKLFGVNKRFFWFFVSPLMFVCKNVKYFVLSQISWLEYDLDKKICRNQYRNSYSIYEHANKVKKHILNLQFFQSAFWCDD